MAERIHWTQCDCGKQATHRCDDCAEPLCDRCLCTCDVIGDMYADGDYGW